MKIWMIRHGKTEGNLQKRYIGATDEPLCAQGVEELKRQKVPGRMDALFVSPLRRCRETASILFPGQEQIVEDDFRECDFGEFENKNYMELAEDSSYQKWVDSMGRLPFPGGESREAFQKRCVSAFDRMLFLAGQEHWDTVGMVVHGGTIMSIMEVAAFPKGNYYEFQTANGCGYELQSRSKRGDTGFFYRIIGSDGDKL